MSTLQDRIDRLKEILIRGDHESFTAFFAGMKENERLELADTTKELYLDAIARRDKHAYTRVHARDDTIILIQEYEENTKNLIAMQALFPWTIRAAFATLPLVELEELELPIYCSHEFEILLERNPPWLAGYVHSLREKNRITTYAYCELGLQLIFDLPRSEETTRLILDCTRGRPFGMREKGNLREFVQQCPRILDEEIWKFFDLPAEALHAADSGRVSGERWDETIISLGKKNILDRNRLLTITLEQIIRNVDSPCVGWACKVHKGLGTKSKEIAPFIETYFDHLEHGNEIIARFSIDMMFVACLENSRYDEQMLDHLDAPLREKTKERAKKTVDLLAAMLNRNEPLRKRILDKVFLALEHDAVDIQAAAMKLLEKQPEFSQPEIVERLQKLSPMLAASVRVRIPCEHIEAPETILKQKSSVAWTPLPLQPITTLEEFIDTAIRLLEVPESMDEAERLFDYMARTTPCRDDEFKRKTSALAKLAVQTYSKRQYSDIDPQLKKQYPNIIDINWCVPFVEGNYHPQNASMLNDIGTTILVWLFGAMPEKINVTNHGKHLTLFRIGEFHLGGIIRLQQIKPSLASFFRNRVQAIASRIATGNSHELLSTPTHQFGWLDPLIFVRRLKDYVQRPESYDNSDKVLALCRLSFEHRKEALAELPESCDEYIAAVRYALGADDVVVGTTSCYWICAARARNPFTNDETVEAVHPDWGPDAGKAAVYRYRIDKEYVLKIAVDAVPTTEPRAAHIDMPTVLFHLEQWGFGEAPKLSIDWTASIWPAQQEPTFAIPITNLSMCIDLPGNLANCQHFFGPLSRPGLRFGENARLLLVLGLCHKNPEVHLPAVDIAIAAIGEDRFDIESFAATVRLLFDLGFARPPRLAKNLAEIARQSPEYGTVIRNLLEHSLAVELKAEHNPLLELLLELCIELRQPVQFDVLREKLAALSTSGKTAKLAKKLLALDT